MAEKAVFIDLDDDPEVYEELKRIAEENSMKYIAPVARKYLKIGLKMSGFNVTAKKPKLSKTDSKKV